MNKLIWLLVLYAAGVATYLLVTRQAPITSAAQPVVPDSPTDRDARILKTEARHFVLDELKTFVQEVEQRIQGLRELHEAMGIELARAKVVAEGAGKDGVEKLAELQAELNSLKEKEDLTLRLAALEQGLPGLKRRIAELERRPAGRVIAAGPATTKPVGPIRPKLPEPDAPDPAAIRAAVAKAVSQLANDQLEVVVLGIEGVRKHGVREAAPRLVEILGTSKHEFARQASAAALGDLLVCDAVIPLADAFVDSSVMVAQQAHRAVRKITGFDSGISPTARIRARRKARGAVIQWWRTHEEEVRARLKQPKSP